MYRYIQFVSAAPVHYFVYLKNQEHATYWFITQNENHLRYLYCEMRLNLLLRRSSHWKSLALLLFARYMCIGYLCLRHNITSPFRIQMLLLYFLCEIGSAFHGNRLNYDIPIDIDMYCIAVQNSMKMLT